MQNSSSEMLMYLKQVVAKMQLSLSEEQYRMFEKYYDFLLEYNQRVNLTRITEPREVAAKHFGDSLAVFDSDAFLPGYSVIDVGSGAGFPGLPLAMMRPDIKMTLVDSLRKRTVFLSEVIAMLGLANVTVIQARAEDLGQDQKYRACFDIVLARAVAPLNVLAELCIPLIKIGGWFLAMKGPKAVDEVELARMSIQKLGGTILSSDSGPLPLVGEIRTLIRIKKIKATPSAYPRKAGTPERQPLL